MAIDLLKLFSPQAQMNWVDKLKMAGVTGVASTAPLLGLTGGAAPEQAPLWDQFARVTSSAGSAPMYGAPVANNVNSIRQANNAAGGGFNGQAYGPWVHKDLDTEMGRISEALYNNNAPAPPWRPLSPQEVSNLGIDPAGFSKPNGMEAALYTDNNGRYALAFRGNDGDPGDVEAVARQLFGIPGGQAQDAIDLANDVKGSLGDQVIFTGHSLGGGLAAIAAANTGTTAVTFAAEGVHDRFLPGDPGVARANAEAGQVRTYNNQQDLLMFGQRFLPWVPQFGVERTLSDPQFDIGNIGASHNMDRILAAMYGQL